MIFFGAGVAVVANNCRKRLIYATDGSVTIVICTLVAVVACGSHSDTDSAKAGILGCTEIAVTAIRTAQGLEDTAFIRIAQIAGAWVAIVTMHCLP